jgi:hypothetical protein
MKDQRYAREGEKPISDEREKSENKEKKEDHILFVIVVFASHSRLVSNQACRVETHTQIVQSC